MSVAWNCEQKEEISKGLDTPFVLEAIREAAEAAGMNPDKAKYCDFARHTQSFILKKAQELKREYHEMTK